MADNIKAPSHYVDGRKYEPKDVIRDWGLNFNLGSAVKYISRAGRKGDILEDLQKAKQFLEFEIEAVEEKDSKEEEEKRISAELLSRAVTRSENPMRFEDVPETLKPFVVITVGNEVLDGMCDLEWNVKSDELRKEIIDHIVEMINKGDLDCIDIPLYLSRNYQEIKDAIERRTSWYTNGVLGHWYYYQNIPDGYKARVINNIAQEVLDNQCDIENDISSDDLREAVIDRIVERIVNGELSSLDIPWRLFEYSRRIRNVVNLKYREEPPFTVRDTITITFNFEKED